MATGAKATIGRALFSGGKSAMAAQGSKASASGPRSHIAKMFSKKEKQMEPSAQLKGKGLTARSTSALVHPDALRKVSALLPCTHTGISRLFSMIRCQ